MLPIPAACGTPTRDCCSPGPGGARVERAQGERLAHRPALLRTENERRSRARLRRGGHVHFVEHERPVARSGVHDVQRQRLRASAGAGHRRERPRARGEQSRREQEVHAHDRVGRDRRIFRQRVVQVGRGLEVLRSAARDEEGVEAVALAGRGRGRRRSAGRQRRDRGAVQAEARVGVADVADDEAAGTTAHANGRTATSSTCHQ